MAEIRVGDDVRAALGTEGIRWAAALFHAGVRCAVCDRELPAAGPVALLLARGGGQYHLSYTHPTCSPSGLIELPTAVMDAVMPDVLDMGGTALVVDHDGQLLPALVAETPTGVPMYADARGDQPGELASVLTTTLLGQGFGLVLNLDELPMRAGDWRIAARSVGPGMLYLEISGRRGLRFYEGTADPPGQWAQLVDAGHWCVLYAAAEPVPWPEVGDPTGTVAALHAVAAKGGLVGARCQLFERQVRVLC